MSTWTTSSPLDFSRTCTQKKSAVVGLSVEMHARGNKVLQTEKPRRDHKILQKNELIAKAWGDKKNCV